MTLLKVMMVFFLIYISQAVSALDFGDRFPAGSERGSIAELIPNFEDLQVEQKCEGKSDDCSEFEDAKSCLQEGRELGCFWSYR